MKSLVAAVSLAAVLLVAAACAGGDDELERALEALAEGDLAIMVLPQEELGDEFADLEVDEDSGFNNNEDEANDTADPDDTAEELEEAGRINGYDLLYIDPDLSALEEGQGVILINTGLDLFEDNGAASDFIVDQLEDFLRLEGEEIESGFTLEEVETFAVGGPGSDAVGLRLRSSFGDTRIYGTTLAFKLDRLVGSVTINRADDTNVDSQAEEIARALEKRIEGVLLGDITGTPVPIPVEEEEGA